MDFSSTAPSVPSASTLSSSTISSSTASSSSPFPEFLLRIFVKSFQEKVLLEKSEGKSENVLPQATTLQFQNEPCSSFTFSIIAPAFTFLFFI